MTRTAIVLATLALGFAQGLAHAQEKFEMVKVYFEQNVNDKDAEVKFEAVSGGANTGLATLKVTAPDGRTVIDFKSADSKLGIRHLMLESPEPKNDGRVQKDFPEGMYKFTGTTTAGTKLAGQATLSHNLPAPTSFVRPKPDEKDVPVQGLKLAWNPIKNMASTVVLIEDEKSGRSMRLSLAGDATTFAVPDGFLKPGTEYKLAIGTVASDGNASYIETGFTTSANAGAKAAAAEASPAPALAAAGAKIISEDEAKKIALKAVPGKVLEVATEKKLGGTRYVVEVAPAKGGKEVDVVIDMTSGKVLAVEK
jgi:hypothetical protein